MGTKLFVSELGLILVSDDKILKGFSFEDVLEYREILDGYMTPSLELALKFLKENRIDKVYVNLPTLIPLIKGHFKVEELNDEEKEIFENVKVEYLVRAKLCQDSQQALERIRGVALQIAKEKIREVSTRLDLHVIQAVNNLDEIDKLVNLLGIRLREWYGLHFPELARLVPDLETYCKIVEHVGSRDGNFEDYALKLGLSKSKAEAIERSSKESKGGDISLEHLKLTQDLAKEILSLLKLREKLAESIEKSMKKIAPNLTSLAGALIGARLIAKAGSLEKLAKLPASTIQVLGAEKALFRALKTGTKPPKHGIIFQHTLIRSSPKKLRGKIARSFSSKLAIAARLDMFRGKEDEELKKGLEKRIKEIKAKGKKA
ncbi:MAG: hypothetical protein QXX95_02620 [Nitrososphaerales archaeon]